MFEMNLPHIKQASIQPLAFKPFLQKRLVRVAKKYPVNMNRAGVWYELLHPVIIRDHACSAGVFIFVENGEVTTIYSPLDETPPIMSLGELMEKYGTKGESKA